MIMSCCLVSSKLLFAACRDAFAFVTASAALSTSDYRVIPADFLVCAWVYVVSA